MLTFQSHEEVVNEALLFIEGSLRKTTELVDSPIIAKRLFFKLFNLKLGRLEHEEIHIALLNHNNGLIGTFCVGRGTIDQCPLFTREFIKLAMIHNAKSMVIAHNHPSQCSLPSDEDISGTKRVKEALALVGVDLLDHIIVTGSMAMAYSMAEKTDVFI